jgi:hypothetical protein
MDIALSDIIQRQDDIWLYALLSVHRTVRLTVLLLVMPTHEFLQAIIKGSGGGINGNCANLKILMAGLGEFGFHLI